MLTPQSVTNNGEYVVWQRQYQITNNASNTYVLSLAEPVGAIFDANLSGPNTVYAPGQITINGIGPGTNIITIVLRYLIPNAAAGPFTFQVDRISGPDTNLTNNLGIDILNSEFCPPVGGAVPDISCPCFDLSDNDTKCSTCTSSWVINPGIVNGTIVSFDSTTGKGVAQHIDPYLPITFTYNLWCINCADGNNYDVSGPANVTIPALFSGLPVPVRHVEQFIVLPGGPGIAVTLAFTPSPSYDLLVLVGGQPEFNYTVLGNQVVFTNALVLGVNEAGPFMEIVVDYFA